MSHRRCLAHRLLARSCPNEKKESAIAFLKAALAYYESLGVTVARVMTDNGSCYRAFDFRDACRDLGLKHIRTKPYTPKTNGKAERFIQTALREWAYAQAYPRMRYRPRGRGAGGGRCRDRQATKFLPENLNRDLLEGVSGRAEAARQVAVEAVLGAAGMAVLVEPDPIKCCGVIELCERRHVDRIGRRPVVGLPAAEYRVDAEIGDEGLGMGEALGLGEDGGRLGLISIHLRNVEHREGSGEHPRATAIAIVGSVVHVLRRCDFFPEDDCGRLLAFAHLAALRGGRSGALSRLAENPLPKAARFL